MDIPKFCIICNNIAVPRLKKGHTQYFQCNNCKTIFCDELDNSSMVGGGAEEERNEQQNHIRVARIDKMIEGVKKEDVNILDFGCGHGLLIQDLKKAGYPNVDGYDAYNEEFSRLPQRNKYHIVIAVEVFEHFASPFHEIDLIFKCLLDGGAVLLETGMLDAAIEDGHDIDTYFYINPEAGHSTIYSNHGLDLLMAKKGFITRQHFNKHSRLFSKPFK